VRLVVAILRPSEFEPVRHALAAVHVTRLTVCDAQEHVLAGSVVTHALGPVPPAAGTGAAAGIAQAAVMEIAVNDDFLERTLDTIVAAMRLAGAAAGRDAADRLFVLPMDEAIQIYRDVRGQEAI